MASSDWLSTSASRMPASETTQDSSLIGPSESPGGVIAPAWNATAVKRASSACCAFTPRLERGVRPRFRRRGDWIPTDHLLIAREHRLDALRYRRVRAAPATA